MREPTDPLTERLRTTDGLGPLLAEAEAVWRSRATPAHGDARGAPAAGDTRGAGDARGTAAGEPPDIDALPVWRPFEDAFPTFYQFTNRPPR